MESIDPAGDKATRLLTVFAVIIMLAVSGYGGCSDGNSKSKSESELTSWPTLGYEAAFSGFSQPLGITHAGDQSGRVFVVERGGRILVVKDGSVLDAPFLDISALVETGETEQGLLGLAFPPGYESGGRFYVDYTRAPDGATVIARHTVSSNPDQADPESAEVLLLQEQPYWNHNGGQMAFGPDGFLYIGIGDGGSSGDPHGNGQDRGTLLGKILRIDVESGTSPYSIPVGNPFSADPDALDEIWALGLRNPWRFSFDRQGGDLYIADVGQNEYEEVNYQAASGSGGGNYGWNIMEGLHCYVADGCDRAGLTLPVAEYDHSSGDCSVTGGYVYRGQAYPGLLGIYIYGDFCSGRIWGMRRSGSSWETTLLLDTGFFISSFGEDENGELYVADYSGGTVYRITAQ